MTSLQGFETLTFLKDNGDQLLTKEYLYNQVWSSRNFLLLEISCLQGFNFDVYNIDPKWPLTSMKNSRGHLLT